MTLDAAGAAPPLGEPVQEGIERLVAAARTGDRSALEALMTAIDRRVYRLAWRLVGDSVLAQDVTQEALLKVCRNLNRYAAGSNWWGWVYRIVLNETRNAQRRQKRYEVSGTLADPAAGTGYDPEHTEQLRRLAEAMSVLSEKERTALVLIDLEGLSSKEAAVILRCLPVTARTRAAHARKRVRHELSRYYPELRGTEP